MPKYKIDLHMHSLISDGITTPCSVVDAARDAGLEKIVITDHNSLHDNFEALQNYAASKGVEIPFNGTEVSAYYRKNGVPFVSFHLLVYGYNDAIRSKEFIDLLSGFAKKPNELIMKDIKAINESGELYLSEEELFLLDGDIAPAWKKMKYPEKYLIKFIAKKLGITLEEVVEKFPPSLYKEYGADSHYGYCTEGINVEDVMKIAKKYGLVTSIAHARWIDPYYDDVDPGPVSFDVMMETVADLRAIGLDGVEVAHQINAEDERVQPALREFAEKNGMICTGGSDFHGSMTEYGCYLTDFGVSDEDFANLENLLKAKRAAALLG